MIIIDKEILKDYPNDVLNKILDYNIFNIKNCECLENIKNIREILQQRKIKPNKNDLNFVENFQKSFFQFGLSLLSDSVLEPNYNTGYRRILIKGSWFDYYENEGKLLNNTTLYFPTPAKEWGIIRGVVLLNEIGDFLNVYPIPYVFVRDGCEIRFTKGSIEINIHP